MKKKRKKLPSIPALKKTAWDLLSKIVRLSHADEYGVTECYTCNKLLGWKPDKERNLEGAQAGHAIPGRHGAVLLDEEILRPQCWACNCRGHGMYHIFSTKLIREHSFDWWECKLVESKKVMKWDRVKLEDKIQSFKERLKELE